ncbi:MAG: hypothetical protein ABSC01_02235 [Verrucomicrobiota bacterium]|jgi:hypothetical protein
MNFFSRKNYEVKIEKPGCLLYREGNYEYIFPVYEEDGQIIVVGFPSRRRVFLLFGWYRIPLEFSKNAKQRALPRFKEYFQRKGKQVRIFDHVESNSQAFAFHSELFAQRGKATELLEEAGFTLFSDYGSVDLLHTEYGLEICGIREESSVEPIAEAMKIAFPQWHYSKVCYKDSGRETGWKFSIHMFPHGCRGGQCVDSE